MGVRRIFILVGAIAAIGLGIALLPSPSPTSAATPTPGTTAKIAVTPATYFKVSGATSCSNTRSGTFGQDLKIAVTDIPSGAVAVVTTFAGRTYTLYDSTSPAWELTVPKSTTFQCKDLNYTSSPATAPWTAQGYSDRTKQNGSTILGTAGSGTYQISSGID